MKSLSLSRPYVELRLRPCESWVMFSIISRNNIPQARTREYECENAWKTTDGEGGGTEQISCIQISRVAMRPRALLFLALRAGTGSRTNTIRKQASKPATLPFSHHQEPSYSRDRHIVGKSKSSTIFYKICFTATVVSNTVFCINEAEIDILK